jgi:NADH:ubiquinone oxidoreductase subunit 5 (subunit L)/multisubunit Na+/H+ antiporter MnhA subunit
MVNVLALFLVIPLLGFVLNLLISKNNERWISAVAISTMLLSLILAVGFVVFWLFSGHASLNIKELVIYSNSSYEFFIDLYFDKVTATYLLVGTFLAYLIMIYSRHYMHKEVGYKRFFNTLLFFYLGFNVVIFSGNFETLFLGWEILGISSFLLIAFYRDRYLPVKNALKVFSIYRVGDIGLILAMWLSHHLWQHNITFYELNNFELVHEHLLAHGNIGLFVSLMVVLAAVAKSAQFPFSFWLPRAMEGPTPSSAIFYGSLSVHIGVFILMRTFPFWEHQPIVRTIVIIIGIITSILASFSTRVQSSIKSQIAYSSIAQIGIIFVEIACGFEILALIHFAGNAFLRSYQLLVSPSVVSYLIKEQFYNFEKKKVNKHPLFLQKIANTVYLMSLKEWNLDSISYHYLWAPFKRVGNYLEWINKKVALTILLPLFITGTILLIYQDEIPTDLRKNIPILFGVLGLITSLKAFVERKSAQLAWFLIFLNHLWIALAVTFNVDFSYWETLIYISGVLGSGAVGYLCLRWMNRHESNLDLERFHGHSFVYKKKSMIFLLATLGMAGFPITPTFLGEDLIFSHIAVNQLILLTTVTLSFIINGLSLVRIFARIFLGPHSKTDHPIPGRSS